MHSWVRYSVAVYVGLLLAGAAVLPTDAELEREALAQPLTRTGRLYAPPAPAPHVHSDAQADDVPLHPCHCHQPAEPLNP